MQLHQFTNHETVTYEFMLQVGRLVTFTIGRIVYKSLFQAFFLYEDETSDSQGLVCPGKATSKIMRCLISPRMARRC